MTGKPFSQACANNREPIFRVLARAFADRRHILEIGSGTGQHAVYMAPRLPHLVWQTSDLAENHAGINAWLDDEGADNIRRPLTLDVTGPWPPGPFDGAFTANTCHIMSWPAVEAMFRGLDSVLGADAVLAVYGPFRYDGHYTSESNARFDQWLRDQAPHQGIRDAGAVAALAEDIGLALEEDNAMPANNQLLVFRRRG